MMHDKKKLRPFAFNRSVFVRAMKMVVRVGTRLALVNHGRNIVNISLLNIRPILLTDIQPYNVSRYWSVKSIQTQPDSQTLLKAIR